jgi:hypothetical protein
MPARVRAYRSQPSMVRRGSTVRVRQRASRKALQMGIWRCLPRQNLRASRVRDGYILGLAGIRGHARRLAAQPETCSRHSIASTHPTNSCKAEVGVACSDARLTPSFAREGVIQSDASAVRYENGSWFFRRLCARGSVGRARLRMRGRASRRSPAATRGTRLARAQAGGRPTARRSGRGSRRL